METVLELSAWRPRFTDSVALCWLEVEVEASGLCQIHVQRQGDAIIALRERTHHLGMKQ